MADPVGCCTIVRNTSVRVIPGVTKKYCEREAGIFKCSWIEGDCPNGASETVTKVSHSSKAKLKIEAMLMKAEASNSGVARRKKGTSKRKRTRGKAK